MQRRGFGYIAAVLILGLLAFMGLFLMQSSSTEYSQAAMSCYATMAQQLAEAAADEGFLAIEKEFKGGKKGPLLRQCQTSEAMTGGGTGGSTGLNPTLKDILPDYKIAAAQTTGILLTHVTRPLFEIESVLPTITDLRPIDHGWFTAEECVFRPKDRAQSFDTKMSRDFTLSLTFNVKVSLKLGSKKHKFLYQITRDMKIINIGPIGRAYSLFSCIGADPRMPKEIEQDLSRGNGRMVFWNIPFQSRIYIHGPAIIGLENPDVYEPGNDDGGMVSANPDVWPGNNQAFQYDDTYAGLSYLGYPNRALWKKRSMFGGSTKEDLEGMSADEKTMFVHNTYKNKGYIPKLNTSWSELQTYFNFGKEYIRGTYKKQVFLPAGPFCRLPWHFTPDRVTDLSGYNVKPEKWPDPNKDLKLEHRFNRDDSTVDENTKIYTKVNRLRLLLQAGTYAKVQLVKELFPEFSISYGNPVDAEGFWSAVFILGENIFKTFWDQAMIAPKLIYYGGEALVRTFVKPASTVIASKTDFNKQVNFFPNNFKNFPKAAVIKLRTVADIPKDENGVWILDGLYWLDYFQTEGDVAYKGQGMIFVGDFVESKPFTIRGNILKFTDPANPSAVDENHLTLVYYPLPSTGRLPDDPNYLNECQMVIEGTGRTIEASVFSFAGIKSGAEGLTNTAGILTDLDYISLGMNPNIPTSKWTVNFEALQKKVNSIVGNYVNFFMKKFRINSDLWIIHDNQSPFYFNKATKQAKHVYTEQDEILAHSVHLSPKIQHCFFSGGAD